ncbi:hypothetical protein AL755_17570 [Arthrobacter sp. ERGS1:01]|nr:hypothetical protein AL755_17570 [Arthrobacter sp. ERGS1:01]
MGEAAVLVELEHPSDATGLQLLLRNAALPGVIDVVGAAQTVLVTAETPAALRAAVRWIRRADLGVAAPSSAGATLTLETVYDGDDLTDAARHAGVSSDALVAWHSGQEWVAAFGGFAPGFMYLSPTQTPISMPRRASPRTVVPAGSVALGGGFSAVYPGPSPGGWQLIGRVGESLWDPERTIPALVQPGDRVRFRPVREVAVVSRHRATPVAEAGRGAAAERDSAGHRLRGFRVLSPGPHTTVQDLGRPGLAHLGLTASGALDRAALRRANRLVGNPGVGTGDAGLEIVAGALALQAVGSQIVAVTGSGTQWVTVSGGLENATPSGTPIQLRDGDTLLMRPDAATGFRSYLAVRGGLDVPAVLGSRSTDALSGTGPAPLSAGMFLPVAAAHAGAVGFPEPEPPPGDGVTVLRFISGPREDWFTPDSVAAFRSQDWTVTAQSNRVGLRLDGVALELARKGELPSEGMVAGAIQLPPSGLPVLFLADHPVTGGYPVIGVVLRADLDKAAQLAPGARMAFRAVP